MKSLVRTKRYDMAAMVDKFHFNMRIKFCIILFSVIPEICTHSFRK